MIAEGTPFARPKIANNIVEVIGGTPLVSGRPADFLLCFLFPTLSEMTLSTLPPLIINPNGW